MKTLVQLVASALGGDGARRLSAAIALLLVLGAAPAAFCEEPPGSSPSGRTDEDDGDDDDGGGDDGASGDETVGTLPSVAEEEGFGPLGGPALTALRGFDPDGSLSFEGRAADIAALLARTRGGGVCGLELLDGDNVRLRLLGDFRLAVRPELLARLKTTLRAAEGLDVRISWRQRSSTVLVGGASELDIPLAGLSSGTLQRAPLFIENVNVARVHTRLTARFEAGLVVLTQERSY